MNLHLVWQHRFWSPRQASEHWHVGGESVEGAQNVPREAAFLSSRKAAQKGISHELEGKDSVQGTEIRRQYPDHIQPLITHDSKWITSPP